jgi:plasmid maintenance system antidote protein VapI
MLNLGLLLYKGERLMSHKPIAVSRYVANCLNNCGKSQSQAAREIGVKPSLISMIIRGPIRIPLRRIAKFADVLDTDRRTLLKLCVQEYLPGFWEVIEECFGQISLTDEEIAIIQTIRKHSKVSNPKIKTIQNRKDLIAVINTFESADQ